MFESLWRREVEVLDISGILTAYGAGIGALELKALVEGYVVGDVDSGEFVAIGSHAEDGCVGSIEFSHREVLVASDSRQHLVLGGAIGSIGKHANKNSLSMLSRGWVASVFALISLLIFCLFCVVPHEANIIADKPKIIKFFINALLLLLFILMLLSVK